MQRRKIADADKLRGLLGLRLHGPDHGRMAVAEDQGTAAAGIVQKFAAGMVDDPGTLAGYRDVFDAVGIDMPAQHAARQDPFGPSDRLGVGPGLRIIGAV